MLTLIGGFDEESLAEAAREYIPIYLKRKDDQMCYVPYRDGNTGTIKHIKFAKLNDQWIYIDNSQ